MSSTGGTKYDPVTLEVMWNRLCTIVEEQATTMMRTSFTNILSDAGDLSAGVFDSKGNMLAQSMIGTPGHINAMATGMRHFLRHHPIETLRPGDVLLGNNAYEISGHLMDFTMVTPAFRGDRLVGFFASTCHTLDIGGRGLSTEGESIYEEGLYVPYLKFYRAGQPNEDLQAMIAANSRTPYEVLGDLRAQVVANGVAARHLLEMMAEFNLEEIDTLGDEIIRRSEEGMRRAIIAVPDGVYEFAVDSDGVDDDDPIHIRCAIDVHGDEIDVDFAGTSPASRKAINCCLNFTRAYVNFGIKAVIAPDIPNNEGSFRPIQVTAPQGSILHAEPPMPTTARHSISHFLPECVMGALFQAMPDRVIAAGAAAIWPIVMHGQSSGGKMFSCIVFCGGGMGARPDKDGLSAVPFPSGVHGTPVEIMETNAPIIIHQKELRPGSGGAGRYRGGLGQIIRVGVRTGKPFRFPALYDRTKFAAKGFGGGADGATGEIWLNGTEPLRSKGEYRLQPEDTITLQLPGGAGFGSPDDREPNAVLRDVISGYISPEAAETAYNVALVYTSGGWEVDIEATARARGVDFTSAGLK